MRDGEFTKTTQAQTEGTMNRLAQELLRVCPVAAAAALLLLARSLCRHLSLPAPEVAQIVEATKASRSAAYDLVAVLAALVPTIAKPCGRPPKPAAQAPGDDVTALMHSVLAFLLQHPGCARAGVRQGYSDHFRRFIVEQREAHGQLDLEAFALAVHVPLPSVSS